MPTWVRGVRMGSWSDFIGGKLVKTVVNPDPFYKIRKVRIWFRGNIFIPSNPFFRKAIVIKTNCPVKLAANSPLVFIEVKMSERGICYISFPCEQYDEPLLP